MQPGRDGDGGAECGQRTPAGEDGAAETTRDAGGAGASPEARKNRPRASGVVHSPAKTCVRADSAGVRRAFAPTRRQAAESDLLEPEVDFEVVEPDESADPEEDFESEPRTSTRRRSRTRTTRRDARLAVGAAVVAVEPGPLEHHADGVEHLAQPALALGAHGQRVVAEALELLERVTALGAGVLVGRHSSSTGDGSVAPTMNWTWHSGAIDCQVSQRRRVSQTSRCPDLPGAWRAAVGGEAECPPCLTAP